jgi:hypothetical protein
MKKKRITLDLSPKLYQELKEVSSYIGISKEEYLLFLLLRTQPIPVQMIQPPVPPLSPYRPQTINFKEIEAEAEAEMASLGKEVKINKKMCKQNEYIG